MKKNVLILLVLLSSSALMAQQTKKQREIGLTFSSLNHFGLSYKTGTSKALWRFNTAFIAGGNHIKTRSVLDSINDETSNFGFGISIGREYRKLLTDKLELRLGADLSFNYASQSNQNGNDIASSKMYRPGFNLVFGFNYLLSKNFSIGAELLPGIGYTTSETVYNNSQMFPVNISGYDYGISNESVMFCLAYKF